MGFIALVAACAGGLTVPLHASAAGTATTFTSLSGPHGPVAYGEAVHFTVQLTMTSGTAPTGFVWLGDQNGPINAATTRTGQDVWVFTTNTLSVGSHSVNGHYDGDALNAPSASQAVTFVVQQSPTTVDLAPSSDPSVPGQHVTFLATALAPSGKTDTTGTIAFADGATSLGTVALDAQGSATITTATLTQGQHSITASYSGDGNYLASTSPALDQQVAPASPNHRFVNQLYNDILARMADAGAAGWVSQLDRHLVSRTQVSLALSSSTEYITDQVEAEYLTLLGRPGDQPGIDYWVTYIQRGATFEQLEISLLGSPEYYTLSGGYPSSFLLALYREVLGRDPELTGSDYWQTRLETGTPQWVVAASVVMSTEAMGGRVTDAYQLLLGRDPDPGGLAYWTTRLQAGTRDETLLGFLAGSDEYWSDTQAL